MATPDLGIEENVPRRRWRIAWLLGIGVLVNYFDRVNLSVSHDALIATFGISNIAFGYLSSSYSWTYAACQLPIGVLLDKFGVKRVGRVGIFLWSVASFAAAATPNLGGLFGARLLLGVGEAPTIGIALLFAGWRWSFALTGVISAAYFVYFWRVYKDPEEDPELSGVERNFIEETAGGADTHRALGDGQTSLGRLLIERKVLGLAIGFGSYNYVFYLLLTWLECQQGAQDDFDRRHSLRAWTAGRGARAHAGTGADLDQHVDWGPVGGIAGGLVASVADCAPQRRGKGGRNYQSFESDFGNLRTDSYRIHGDSFSLVCVGLWCGGGLSGHRNHRIYLPARQDRADAS